ncbi:hypothetical protein TWF481_012264 [Arthrobotrys musiformis]|uniref:Uncharacterized protein n=1 Tax=Arthrobotrys musiformis TaxID=47236 RepID=A0AAV9VYD5_9PEZI
MASRPTTSIPPVVQSKPIFSGTTVALSQVETLIFTEFKQLLLSSRFNFGPLPSRRRRLISAFESPPNVPNVLSFCSRHKLLQSSVSESLVTLVDKITSGALGRLGTFVAPVQFSASSEPANHDHVDDGQIRSAERVDSDEEMLDAPAAKNSSTPSKSDQDQNTDQSPSQRVGSRVLGRQIEVVQSPVTPLKEAPQSLEGNASRLSVPSQRVDMEDYNRIPSYTPLPVLIGGTALEVNGGSPFSSRSPAERKSKKKAVLKEIQGVNAATSPPQPLVSLTKRKTRRGRGGKRRALQALVTALSTAKTKKKIEVLPKHQELPQNTIVQKPEVLTTPLSTVKTNSTITPSLPLRPDSVALGPTASPGTIPSHQGLHSKANLETTPSMPKKALLPAKPFSTTATKPIVVAANPSLPRPPQTSQAMTVSQTVESIINQNFPSLHQIFLPYPVQFVVLTETQYVLECVCHGFAKKWLPHLTSTAQFLYPESAELSLWIRTISIPSNFAMIPAKALDVKFLSETSRGHNARRFLDQSAQPLVRLRNQAVHRHNIECGQLNRILQVAIDLANFLKAPAEAKYLKKVREKQDGLATSLKKQLGEIRADIRMALTSLYFDKRQSAGWSDSVVKIGLERTNKATESIKLTLDEVRALKHIQSPRKEKNQEPDDIPMDISDGSDE